MSAFKLGRGESTTKTPTAGVLASLKFSTETKPTKQATEQRRPADVVLEFLNDQINLAKADIVGTDYTVSRTRFLKDDAGKPVKKTVNVVPRRAFWQSGAEWLVALKYGNVPVELAPGSPSIVAGARLDDVVKTFELIKKAVESDECDAQIAAAAEKARRNKGNGKAA